MKVRLYTGNMNLNRKKVCRYTKILFFRKQNGENFFLDQIFSSPMGYLAGIMF